MRLLLHIVLVVLHTLQKVLLGQRLDFLLDTSYSLNYQLVPPAALFNLQGISLSLLAHLQNLLLVRQTNLEVFKPILVLFFSIERQIEHGHQNHEENRQRPSSHLQRLPNSPSFREN